MSDEPSYKFEVEIHSTEERQKIPLPVKERLREAGMADDKGKLSIKGVSPKMLRRMKKEYVQCPVLEERTQFLMCFMCSNFQSRVMGKVLCRGQPLPGAEAPAVAGGPAPARMPGTRARKAPGRPGMLYSYVDGDPADRRLLGGKGAGLCEMTQMGLNVPPGFVITTEVCKKYYESGKKLPPALMGEVMGGIARLEKETGKSWGSAGNPLLVSVRSGAAVSMPGMMDTILNLGMNERAVEGLAGASGGRFAWDSYRRFVQLFGKVVFGLPDGEFEAALSAAKKRQGVSDDAQLDEGSLRRVVGEYMRVYARHGKEFPSEPRAQLELAIKAVFESWSGQRAVVYRRMNGIGPETADGTAVNVVAMAFGNMGEDSATGVVFTRNPGDGTPGLFGEYLVNAQGEDVVAGVRTPRPVQEMEAAMPGPYAELVRTCGRLEKHFREPQDIEFTVERGKFYLLQTRRAKMNAAASVRTSVDMVAEKMISKKEAILRLDADQLEQLLHDTLDPRAAKSAERAASGIAASPGAASGRATFDVKKAASLGEAGQSVILVREETKPEDVPAFFASKGVLTSRGGKTSHAAVVARGMGMPCIVGCAGLKIGRRGASGAARIRDGETITIDGSTGAVYRGSVRTVGPKMTRDFETILAWASEAKKLGVRANADTPEMAERALKYGAEGIGLCRTERMFNDSDRIEPFRDMIMAGDEESRRRILAKLERLQRRDFARMFSVMRGRRVTVRLLDPPLHEFLPSPGGPASAQDRALQKRAAELAETNPMMGHRGVRVGITYPEIYEMQIRAVLEAAADCAAKGVRAMPQIMVPQVGSAEELGRVKKMYERARARTEAERGGRLDVSFGTMIEVVRACATAGRLAGDAEFFSFGTNDLTQAVFSFSREDAEAKFLSRYMEDGILERNPFQTIDEEGVGKLVSEAVSAGRGARRMEMGVCGEHGGDPASVRFFHSAGLDYVSASPYRIPTAVVAAAQAALA